MRRHEKIHRINLELGPKSFQALGRLQEALEASSQAETIRMALQVVLRLAEALGGGGRLIIEQEDGERTEILLPFSPSTPRGPRRVRPGETAGMVHES